MGQKANPIGNRLGIIRGWDSAWFGGKHYAEKLIEDDTIRNYLKARLPKSSISRIVIERTQKLVTVTIHTARPGVIIGKGGQELDIQINIFEVKRPEVDARIVADGIARQIEARISHKRCIKMSIASAMRMGAEGIKVRAGGRLGGVEIARSEEFKEGRTPLHTLRADIDFAIAEAHTSMGRIGIKVWICRGEVFGKRDLSPNIADTREKKGGSKPRNERPNHRDNHRGAERRGGRDNNRR
jgi:small subunit ribosomal protein S3